MLEVVNIADVIIIIDHFNFPIIIISSSCLYLNLLLIKLFIKLITRLS